jgi:predicted Zn-dependent protease
MWISHSRMPTFATISLFAVVVLFGGAVRAQRSCSVTPVLGIPTTAHIFNAQQEQALGDLEAEWMETNYHVIQDDGLAIHLDAVAGRILSQFPPSQARVRVILIDTPEADSFSMGPERIYITQKMVTLLKNDDELAGLLGHEISHILTHQNAIVVTELFHEILGVDAVSDRKDISGKLIRIFASIDRDKKAFLKAAQIMQRSEDIHQCEADRVAMYAAAAAGYSPQAYVELFDRFAKTNGSTGNVLTDFLGATTSNEKRLREIHKTLRRLPQPCREIVPAPSGEFLTWQAAVISYPDLARR